MSLLQKGRGARNGWLRIVFRLETAAGTTRLTEVFPMCVPLPFGAVIFERLFRFIWDRRTDLQKNLELSLDRIRATVEAGVEA